jgi:predicted nucleic acid-binding protein
LAEAAVVDASPLIYLSATSQLPLLRLAAEEVLVPRAVADEVGRWGEDDPTARALAATPWLRVIDTPSVPASIEAWNLGPGESAVLAYAIAHPGVQPIIDDLAGRRCAVVHHLEFRGCVGLVLVAKQRGSCFDQDGRPSRPVPLALEPGHGPGASFRLRAAQDARAFARAVIERPPIRNAN